MTANGSVGRHLIRYGIAADQKYLVGDFLDTYDQLVINASMVAHQPSALAMFITQRAACKPYLIDPQTHAFQHDIDLLRSKSNGEIKGSIQKLLEEYGAPLKDQVIAGNSILPVDFDNDTIRCDFCQRVIRYQLKAISSHAQESDESSYYDFIKEIKGIENFNHFQPNVVVAPYFYMTSNTFDEWFGVNINCARDSIEFADEESLSMAIQIVISKDVLYEENQIDRIINEYSKVRPAAFYVWVDDFNEQEASESLLRVYINFIDNLRKSDIPVISLYGSYFSVLLLHKGLLNGVTHSFMYGEHRAVVPVGGGIPVAKYYLPCLHHRLQARDALRAIRVLDGLSKKQAFYDNICDCEQCRNIIINDDEVEKDFLQGYGHTKATKNSRQYPTQKTKDNNTRHYMWCKHSEYSDAVKFEARLEQLKEAGENEQLKRAIGLEDVVHCKKWYEVLKGLKYG